MKTGQNKMLTKQRLIVALLCVLLSVGVTVGAVFAFTRLAFKSDEQTIVASNIYFKVNGKTFRDQVTPENLAFARGESRDVELNVEFLSGGSESAVNYEVELKLGEGDNRLAQAIEVYRKTDGGYEFFGMLGGLAGYKARGVAVANQPASVESFRFVYSPAAGDAYENATFALNASVTGEVTTSTVVGGVVYVNDLTPLTATAQAGKTVRLMKDVTLTEDLTFDAPYLLDLNGHTLTVDNGKTLTVNYADGAAGSAYKTYGSLAGIVDSKTGGAVVGSLHVLSCGSDLYLLGDGVDLTQAAVTFADGVLSGGAAGFFDAVTYNYEKRVAGKTFVLGETVPLIANLGWYLDQSHAGDLYNSFTLTAENNALVYDSASRAVKAHDVGLTNNYSFNLKSNDGAYSVRGGATVRGSSAYAVAEAYVDALPNPVTASLFFPTFDRASGLALTWIVDDGCGGAVMDADGAYLKGGVDSLDDWSDRTARISLIAGEPAGGENADAVGDYHVSVVTRRVVVMSEELRTEKLYTVGQLVVEENIPYRFADYLNEKYYAASADGTVNKANLTAITVDLGEEGAKYLAVTGEGLATALEVVKVPDKTSASFDVSVTFHFTDKVDGVALEKSYAFGKSVLVLGYTESVTIRNAQSTIQSWLDDTDYVKNGGGGVFDLTVPSYLSGTGDLVEYALPADIGYVFVKDDIYVQNASGRFYAVAGGYKYFAAYYTTTGASADDHDVMLGSGAAAQYYKVTENKNGAVIIIDGTAYAYDGGKNCYDRSAVISVLPEKVPPRDTDVSITARVYRLDAQGNKLYCRADGTYSQTWSDANPRLEYSTLLTVRGILHNNADEIADSAVYSTLLEYYDLNGDGYIGLAEAQAVWSYDSVSKKYVLSADGVTNGDYKAFASDVITLSGLNINSIKGLEYFVNAHGYDLSGNAVSDLSPLAKLTEVNLFYLSSNRITDLSPLAFLDKLASLSLSDNNITDIAALEYLRNLSYLNLANNVIADYLPLIGHTNLSAVYVHGNPSSTTVSARYALALVYENNKHNWADGYGGFYLTGNSPYTFDADLIANAQSLRRLNEIGQVYKTLHLPTAVNGQPIVWRSGNPLLVEIGKTALDGAAYYPYTINTPAVDTTVTLTAVIGEGDTQVSRAISVLLLSDRTEPGSNEIWLETTGGYKPLKEAVPDKALRSLLASLVNSDDRTEVNVGGATVNGLRAITIAEIEKWAVENVRPQLYWSGSGIENLAGIKYFAPVFDEATLDLSANELSDLTPLASLTTLKSLRLGGMQYDFSQLNGLTSLESLFVYECYGLSDDETVGRLYNLYIANKSVSIYKDSATEVWDPYAELMPRYVRSLPSFYAFMDAGDSYTLLDGALNADGKAFCTFTFYGNKVTFVVTGREIKGADHFSADDIYNTVKLKTPAARDTTSYARYTLSGNDGRGTVTYEDYYVELLAETNTRFIVDDNGTLRPLTDVFTGYTIRAAVLKELYADASLQDAIAAAKASGGYCTVSAAKFASMSLGSLTVDGTYETDDPLGGLQYLTKVTNLTLARDANLGDGSGLQNITDLTVKYSFINFSSITMPLPKLKNLTVSGSNTSPVLYKKNANAAYYELKYGGETYLVPEHDYYLRWFTGLETLTLNDNNMTIGDWTFLLGLLFTDDGNGQRLNISQTATSGLKYGDKYVTHTLEALNAYNNPNTYVVTTASGNTLNLGTLNGSVSGTFPLVGGGSVTYDSRSGFGIVAALFRAAAVTDPNGPKYQLIAGQYFSMTNKSYSFAVDPAKEYAEFNAAVTETGASVNGTLLSQLDDQSVSGGEVTLSLPLTTYAYTGTDFGDDTFTRAFGIKWALYGTSADLSIGNITIDGKNGVLSETIYSDYNNESTLDFGLKYCDYGAADTVVPSRETYKTSSLDFTLASTHDYYIVVVGTIGEYYYDNANGKWAQFETAQEKYTYVYPLLIKSGNDTDAKNDSSFAKITDTALRFVLFTSAVDKDYDGTLTPYKNLDNNKKVTKQIYWNWNGGNISNYGDSRRHINALFPKARTNYTSPLNLTGLRLLGGLSEIRLEGLPLTNIDEITHMTSLTSINIRKSAVTKLPELPASIKTVILSNNNINDLSKVKKCDNLTSIDLSANDISSDMLQYFYDPQTGANNIPNVTSLNLTDNQCASEYPMIEWAYLFTGATSTLTALNGWTGNKDTLGNLRSPLVEGLKPTGGVAVLQFADYKNSQTWSAYCENPFAVNNFEHTGNINETVSLGQFSLSFVNNSVYNSVKGDSSIYLAQTQVLVKLLPSGSEPPLCWLTASDPLYVNMYFNRTDQNPVNFIGRDGSKISVAEFDGGLATYLMEKNFKWNDTDQAYKLSTSTFSINSDYGITSLKGLNKLGITSISISNNPLLSSLWGDETYDSLTSLTLGQGGCHIASENLISLAKATALTTLNLRYARGVDYSKLGVAFSKIEALSVSSAFFAGDPDVSSVRNGYIKLFNGTFAVGVNHLEKLTSLTVYNSYKIGSGTEANDNTKNIMNDSLAYLYAQSLAGEYASVKKLAGSSIYGKDDTFFWLSNVDAGAIFAMMSGTNRSVGGDTNQPRYYKMPIGETLSYNDLSNPMTIKLPKSITYNGREYAVTYKVSYGENDVTAYFIDSSSVNTFTLSAPRIDNLKVSAASATLTVRAEMTYGGKTIAKEGTITINDIKSASSSSTSDAIDYEYYVETSADGACLPADRVFESGRLIEWVFGGSSGIGNASTKYKNNGVYTSADLRAVTYDTTTTCGVTVSMTGGWGIKASEANKTFSYNGATLGDNAVVLTYDFCQRLYSLDTTSTASGNGGNSMGITSIAGVETFANLKEIYFVAGNFTDLSPLSGLHLALFSYQNAGGGNAEASYVTDFSPLVRGSGASLEVFVYDTYSASVQPRDMNFLVAFAKLKEAYLFGSSPYSYNAIGSSTTKADLVQYLAAPSFSYLVSALAKTDARLYLGAATTNKSPAQAVTDFLAGSSWRGHYNTLNIVPAYGGARTSANNFYAAELRPKDSIAATDALASFNTTANADYNVSGGYALTLNGGKTTVNSDGNVLTVRAKLPAMLASGYLYAIDWQSGSSHLTVDGYGVTGSLTAGGTTYDKDRTFASYAEFAAFLAANESAVYNAMNTGAFGVYVNVTLTVPGSVKDGALTSDLYQSFMTLFMKTEISGVSYERMLSVDIAATLNAAAKI